MGKFNGDIHGSKTNNKKKKTEEMPDFKIIIFTIAPKLTMLTYCKLFWQTAKASALLKKILTDKQQVDEIKQKGREERARQREEKKQQESELKDEEDFYIQGLSAMVNNLHKYSDLEELSCLKFAH